jgi:hypothetical protein
MLCDRAANWGGLQLAHNGNIAVYSQRPTAWWLTRQDKGAVTIPICKPGEWLSQESNLCLGKGARYALPFPGIGHLHLFQRTLDELSDLR